MSFPHLVLSGSERESPLHLSLGALPGNSRLPGRALFETPAGKTRAPQGERRFAFQKQWAKSVRPEEPPSLWRRLEGRACDTLPIAGKVGCGRNPRCARCAETSRPPRLVVADRRGSVLCAQFSYDFS